MPLFREPGPVDAEAIQHSWLYIGKVTVENMIRALFQLDASHFQHRIFAIKKAQFDFLSMFTEQRKIGPFAIPVCA